MTHDGPKKTQEDADARPNEARPNEAHPKQAQQKPKGQTTPNAGTMPPAATEPPAQALPKAAQRRGDVAKPSGQKKQQRAQSAPRKEAAPDKPPAQAQQPKPNQARRKPPPKKRRPPRRGNGPMAPPLPIVERAIPPLRRGMETGHWVSLITLGLIVVLPALLVAWYLWSRAADQYASHIGFTVQRDVSVTSADVLYNISGALGGAAPRSDTDIINEHLVSPAMIARLDQRLDLRGHYSAPHDRDPIFALSPQASLSDLMAYWWRVLYVRYDSGTGLIDVRVQAFDPDFAHQLAREVLREADLIIAEIARQAREDAIRFAQEDVERAQARLRTAREALIAFQTRSQILDPETDIEGRISVINTLQAQLAEALVSLDTLREITQSTDPRVERALREVDVISLRIAAERSNMGIGPNGGSYPALLAEYQDLAAAREHAAAHLTDAFLALDAARDEAARQARYVIAYVAPTQADTAIYPKRMFWLLASLGASFLLWFLINVAYVSVRDRR